MSDNIEHRSFWEFDGRPYHTIEYIDASRGRKAIAIKRVPTMAEVKREQERRAFIERLDNLYYMLAHLDNTLKPPRKLSNLRC